MRKGVGRRSAEDLKQRSERVRAVIPEGQQRKMAERLFGDPNKSTVVNGWCRGKKRPSLENYIRLAEVTGKSVDWFLARGADEEEGPSLEDPWRSAYTAIANGVLASREVLDLRTKGRGMLTVASYDQRCHQVALGEVERIFQPYALTELASSTYVRAYRGELGAWEGQELSLLRQRVHLRSVARQGGQVERLEANLKRQTERLAFDARPAAVKAPRSRKTKP